MVKTFGSIDKIRKRRTRSDKGKLHKTYRGKILPKKRVKPIKFTSRKGNKDSLKLFIWEVCPMENIQNWNRKIRHKISRTVYKPYSRVDSLVAELSNKDRLETWAINNIQKPGSFVVRGCTGTPKTKTKIKWVRLFSVKMTSNQEGISARITKLDRIYRFWFWDKR